MVRPSKLGASKYFILITLIAEASLASVSLFGFKPLGKLESALETQWIEKARRPAAYDQQEPPKAPQPVDMQTTFGMTLNAGLSDMAEVLKCSSTIDLNTWEYPIPNRLLSPFFLDVLPISYKKTKFVFRSEVGMNRELPVAWETGFVVAISKYSELQLWTHRNHPRFHWNLNF